MEPVIFSPGVLSLIYCFLKGRNLREKKLYLSQSETKMICGDHIGCQIRNKLEI